MTAGTFVALTAQVTDDCNNPVPNATVVAVFSNGDPALTLAGDGLTNLYSETWQPNSPAANASITLRAAVPLLQPASLVLAGTIEAGTAPLLSRGGTVNNLNPRLDAPLSPGDVVQIFGANLATQYISAASVPLPTSLAGTVVVAGTQQLPLYFASPGQINAELPVTLPAGSPQSILVANNGAYSLPDEILITPVDPGVATASGVLIAQHADFTLVSADRPAKPGETLVMYLVGMGSTNPPGVTGSPQTGSLASAVVQPVVTVGGQPAVVAFAGLTPGGIGLYQINFTVPTGALPGLLDVNVTQGDQAANTSKLLVGQ